MKRNLFTLVFTILLSAGPLRADRKLYIYDFENQEETLSLDFNLSKGERFTTFNGMEWVVESVGDTLVNMSHCGIGECVTKKLLKVKTLDGTRSDQWLEDFGSLSNHFMISSMEGVEISQTLWVEYDFGEYIAREINADPFFAHDSGWLDGAYGDSESGQYAKCTYENGRVAFESVQWWYEHRDYTCFYRDGDNIYKLCDSKRDLFPNHQLLMEFYFEQFGFFTSRFTFCKIDAFNH